MTFRASTFRGRLTLWYSGVLTLVLALFFLSVYLLVRVQLLTHHDRELTATARAVRDVLSRFDDCEHLTPGQLADLNKHSKLILFHSVEGGAHAFYRSPDLESERRARELSATPAFLEETAGFKTYEEPRFFLRVYTMPYQSRVGRKGLIRVMERIGEVREPLQRLRLALILLGPLAVLSSSLVGYWIAGKAVARVDEITTLAREIEATQLSRRLPVPAADDEIGRLVETLNQMIGRLEGSFESMKRFTADASHELRSPLANIQATIEAALARTRTGDEYRAALGSAAEDVTRLRGIVEELLVLARADSGRIDLESVPVRLDVIATEVVESFRERASEAGVIVTAPGSAAVVVSGDERWLRQLAFNLVDNAVKFAVVGRSSAEPSVEVAAHERNGLGILTVSDTGPGIAEEELDRVFERFYRADTARSHRGNDGFGLGLAIAAWIVEAHHGAIRAENLPGGGTRFMVELPLQKI